jgi:hypothetical protein
VKVEVTKIQDVSPEVAESVICGFLQFAYYEGMLDSPDEYRGLLGKIRGWIGRVEGGDLTVPAFDPSDVPPEERTI